MTWRATVQLELGALRLDVDVTGRVGPTVIVGPNGSGKTTLLRVLAGAQRPDTGTVALAGRTVFDSAAGVDLPVEGRGVGYVPQGYGLFPHLTVVDNVAFGLRYAGSVASRPQRRTAALACLEELGCAHLAQRRPARLSGGERQRVALARALAPGPGVLLLDEPLAALDVTARRSVRGFLVDKLNSLGVPSVVVTHDVRDAAALGGPVLVLEAGRVTQTGTLEQLRTTPATDFVSEFAGVWR